MLPKHMQKSLDQQQMIAHLKCNSVVLELSKETETKKKLINKLLTVNSSSIILAPEKKSKQKHLILGKLRFVLLISDALRSGWTDGALSPRTAENIAGMLFTTVRHLSVCDVVSVALLLIDVSLSAQSHTSQSRRRQTDTVCTALHCTSVQLCRNGALTKTTAPPPHPKTCSDESEAAKTWQTQMVKIETLNISVCNDVHQSCACSPVLLRVSEKGFNPTTCHSPSHHQSANHVVSPVGLLVPSSLSSLLLSLGEDLPPLCRPPLSLKMSSLITPVTRMHVQ
ncbi:hypothetical protein JOB18_000419 [Solea senegalensis]|uniref:Uncharacterized protein n=1 Tax=Solea senegalensis TaxID=28829 RepID=A0AAV6S931_SOLSE|nr:hypothetical protein JOB18_000419 [Solea senegalensis]